MLGNSVALLSEKSESVIC